MISDRKTEEFLDKARSLPPVLDRQEVAVIIAKLPSLPQSKKWTDYLNLNTILMIGTLTALLIYGAISLNSPLDSSISVLPDEPATSVPDIPPVIPFKEQQPAIAAIGLPVKDAGNPSRIVLQKLPMAGLVPISQLERPTRTLENKKTNFDNTRLVTTQQTRETTTAPLDWQPELEDPIFKGNWIGIQFEESMILVFEFEVKGQNWRSWWNLSASAELDELIENPMNPQKSYLINRAAGQVQLMSSRQRLKGTFEFIPNTKFKRFLRAEGFNMDKGQVRNISFKGTNQTTGEPDQKYYDMQEAVTWFRYFLINMNESYLYFLKRSGFQREEMSELWLLADRQVTLERLGAELPLINSLVNSKVTFQNLVWLLSKELTHEDLYTLQEAGYQKLNIDELAYIAGEHTDLNFDLTRAMLTAGYERPALTELLEMSRAQIPVSLIHALKKTGYLEVTPRQVIDLHRLSITPEYILKLGELPLTSISATELKEFGTYGLPLDFARKVAKSGRTDLNAGHYLKLWVTKTDPLKLDKDQHIRIPLDLSEWDRLNAGSAELTGPLQSFQRLVVRGNIRVVLKKGNTHQATVKAEQTMLNKIKLKLNKEVLTISPKPGFVSSHLYDVEVQTMTLNSLSTRGGAKVFTEDLFNSTKLDGDLYSIQYLLGLGKSR